MANVQNVYNFDFPNFVSSKTRPLPRQFITTTTLCHSIIHKLISNTFTALESHNVIPPRPGHLYSNTTQNVNLLSNDVITSNGSTNTRLTRAIIIVILGETRLEVYIPFLSFPWLISKEKKSWRSMVEGVKKSEYMRSTTSDFLENERICSVIERGGVKEESIGESPTLL